MIQSDRVSGQWRTHVTRGWMFLRDHPQLWFTLFVAVVITVSFVFMALRFAAIARDAQEQLFNDRAGWLLNGVVTFAPEVLGEQVILRERLRVLTRANQTIENIMILVPQDDGEWRTYVDTEESKEGRVLTYDPARDFVFDLAWKDEDRAFTGIIGEGGVRKFVTARQIPGTDESTKALAVATLTLSEADRILTRDLYVSMGVLVVVLLAILILLPRNFNKNTQHAFREAECVLCDAAVCQ